MILDDLLKDLPKELVNHLLKEFNKLHANFFLGKWGPSELNGGRFGEAVLRILEYKDIGNYTPIGKILPRKKITNSAVKNTSLDTSLRLNIPPLTEFIMDVRNTRNVAHLGIIDVSEMDSTIVIQIANWIMAEIVRIEGQTSPEKAQQEIKKIIERKLPIIEEIDGRLKVLNPKFTAKEKILVICYQKYPEFIEENTLFKWVEEKNKSRFKKYLVQLHRNKLIDYHEKHACLTKLGLIWVEKNIEFKLEV